MPSLERHVITSESVSQKTAIGATWLIAWRMATRLLGVITTLVMARILLPADFGLLAMATTFALAIESFSQLGLQEALIRRPEDDEHLHDTAFTLQLARALFTAAVVAAVAPAASDWFDEPRLTTILWALSAASAVGGLHNIGVVAFRRKMNYRQQFILLSVPRLIQVALTIPIALMLRSYWALVVGICISKCAEVAMSYLAHPYRPKLSLFGWRELASFSLWTWAASIASVLWTRCDPFVIGPATGPTALGIYLLAAEIAILPVTELVAPATEALYSGFSMAQKNGTADPLASAVPVATILLLVVTPLTIAISGTSGYIVASVLGPRWADAQPVIAIAAWLGLFSPYSFVCSTALVSANRVKANFLVNCAASIIKCSGLVAIVSITINLSVITTVGVIIVGLESGFFLSAIVMSGSQIPRNVAASIGRIFVAGAATAALMFATNLAWQRVTMSAWKALLVGTTLGCGAIVAFVCFSTGLWIASGKPEGPELRIHALLVRLGTPLFARIWRVGDSIP